MTPVQDSIDFALMAEETVVNNTVKLTATISGIITPDMIEAKLKDGIREMMKKFISNATWHFSGLTRTNHPSGMEEIMLTATSRVSESENSALDKRIRDVSKEGMSITNISVDTSPPASMIEETESRLRVLILAKAMKELATINTAMGDTTYRLGNVVFQNTVDNFATSNMRKSPSMMASASTYGGLYEDEILGNAVKLIMRANIGLRRIVA